MVVPIIAAGARVAGPAVVRGGASAGARGAGSAARGAGQPGSKITRTRRTSSQSSRLEMRSANRTEARSRGETPRSGVRTYRNIRGREGYDEQSEDEFQSGGTAQTGPVKYRIGALVSLALLYVALVCDVLELALDVGGTFAAGIGVVIGYAKDAVVLVFFPAIFFILGAPFWKGKKAGKKMATMGGAFLVSLIPWVGAVLPETFLSVLATIYLTRKEDKEKSLGGDASSNVTRSRRDRQRIRRR